MKRVPNKSRVGSVSRIRKSAMMGAAATALIAVAPAFGADAQSTEASLQAAIRNILRTPVKETSWRANAAATPGSLPRFSAIDIGNGDDISVGADEVAISHAETEEDINLVNTGNLTGGVGIEVSSGAINLAESIEDVSGLVVQPALYQLLYDDAGNIVSYGTATAEITLSYRDTTLVRDPLASRITIDNSGSIDFSGREGISAANKSGESITINNSGDIASTQDTEGRAGIYATTESYSVTRIETLTDPGEFTYNANGQLTGVIETAKWDVDLQAVDMEYDGGTINIHNTGDIDMGDVGALAFFTEIHSAGIYAKGDGGTTIDNEGDIKVGRGSFGIRAVSQGNASITNSGRIDMGNASAGISVWRSNGNAGDYRLSGDTYVLNTGDIIGGITKDELEPGEMAQAAGIHVVAPGSTNEYVAGQAHWNLLAAEYNEILGSDVYTIYDVPNLVLFDTTTINRGHIELKDGGVGIAVDPLTGFSTAINEGTIIVGDGNPDFQSVTPLPSAGIYQSNLPHNGPADITSINAESGIIITGDDSIGVGNEAYLGSSVVINEGSITTGNGVVGTYTAYGEIYDRLFTTQGLFSRSFARFVAGTTAYARNSGSITVGDLAIGSQAVGNGAPLLDPTRPTAININDGIITTGDNSIGMATSGMNTIILNTGTITTGSFDISAYETGRYGAGQFAELRAGATASSWRYAELINYGTITVGDGKIGAVARSANSGIGYTASLQQSDTGVITTGDHAIGARVHGNLFSFFASAGEISVGDDSVGVEITSGDAFAYSGANHPTTFPGVLQAFNSGIIETGDNSTGIRMNGVREDRSLERLCVQAGSVCSVYLLPGGLLGDGRRHQSFVPPEQRHDPRGRQLDRRRDHRHGWQRAGPAAVQCGHDRRQPGRVSTALRLNADRNLDSYAINVGTIAGDITFGAGDDKLINTLMIDNAGRITHSGNIVMNGSTIDFGAGNNSFDNDRGTDHHRGWRQPDHRCGPGHDRRQHRGAQQRRRQQPDHRRQPVRRLHLRRRRRRWRSRSADHHR